MRQIKFIFTVLLGMCAISVYGQFGYTVNGKRIVLTERVAEDVFMLAKEKVAANLSADEREIYKNGFLMRKAKTAKAGGYVSKIYMSDDIDSIMIMPKIILSCENDVLDVILQEYGDVLSVEKHIGNRHRLLVDADNSEAVLTLVNKLEKINGVAWCEPGILGKIVLCGDSNPLFDQQYYLKNTGQKGGTSGIDINVEPAWELVNGSSDIVVAVIDQGVDRGHEDMANCVLEGYTIGYPNGKGAPINENVGDCKGHGVACAGIIAAEDNNLGIRGVASGVKILPINIVPYYYIENVQSGFAPYYQIADAIDWAAERADVLSCSWNYDTSSNVSNDIATSITEARTQGRNGKGCVVVFSSGNYNSSIPDVSFPANVDGVITVGAIDGKGNIWDYSQRGSSMDLVAPSGGEDGDIVSTDRMGSLGYDREGNYVLTFNGTSAACPQVAGVAALMLSANPQLTENQVRTILHQTARDFLLLRRQSDHPKS